MRNNHIFVLTTALAIGHMMSHTVTGQTVNVPEPSADIPRLPNGRPDLQGYWTTQTYTPLERPDRFKDREFLTEEEATTLSERLTAAGVDPSSRIYFEIENQEELERYKFQENRRTDERHHIHYDNEIWLRTSVPKGLSSRRTSLVIDPPNGRFPPLTPKGSARIAAAAAARSSPDAFEGYHTRPLNERCWFWPHEGPPMMPPSYNDIHQIFQTEDHVVIFTELGNNPPRIIPLDGRPHISDKIRQFPGDSRGRWEGDTLVVETRNYKDRRRFRESTEFLHVVERFTRVDADTVHYVFTVDDPTMWVSSWTAEVPLIKTDGPMYEYACHEGNHDIRHILEIARNLEAQQEN
tara:strand:+ start:1998 stop:3050 length:1053 start_codon:yes stop_codon:yes gene_type:complete